MVKNDHKNDENVSILANTDPWSISGILGENLNLFSFLNKKLLDKPQKILNNVWKPNFTQIIYRIFTVSRFLPTL